MNATNMYDEHAMSMKIDDALNDAGRLWKKRGDKRKAGHDGKRCRQSTRATKQASLTLKMFIKTSRRFRKRHPLNRGSSTGARAQ